jgi:hypothetical protein
MAPVSRRNNMNESALTSTLSPQAAQPVTLAQTPFQPTRFRFTLENIHIDNTRALGNDTDIVAAVVTINGKQTAAVSRDIGDVNNGDHAVGVQLTAEVTDPGTPVKFCFAVTNSGFDRSAAAVSKAALDRISGVCKDIITGAFGFGKVWEEADKLVRFTNGLIFVDCDGPVAAEMVGGTGQELWDKTEGATTLTRESKFFPGSDSATLCGGNSKYTVAWSVAGEPLQLRPIAHFNNIVGVAGYSGADGFQHVIVATKDRNVTEIFFKGGGQPIGQDVLRQLNSDIVGVAGYSGADGFQHVIVATKDRNVTEIFFKGGGQPIGQDVLRQLNSDIVGVAGYSGADGFQHVIVATHDGNLTDIFFKGGGQPVNQRLLTRLNGLTAMAAFTDREGLHYLTVGGGDGTLYEFSEG